MVGKIGIRCRCRPCTRRRARLASWRAATGERPIRGGIWSKGTANRSWSTNAGRSAGPRVPSTTSSARPTESASRALCSGSTLSRVTIGSRTCTLSGSSGWVRRERNRLRQTQPTTVVSQPPMFSMALASVRLSRSQASWTVRSICASIRTRATHLMLRRNRRAISASLTPASTQRRTRRSIGRNVVVRVMRTSSAVTVPSFIERSSHPLVSHRGDSTGRGNVTEAESRLAWSRPRLRTEPRTHRKDRSSPWRCSLITNRRLLPMALTAFGLLARPRRPGSR
jgi:hypothetical protein